MIYRDNRGRFSGRKIVKNCIPFMFVIVATIYATSYFYNPEPIHFTQIIEKANAKITLEAKVKELKKEMLKELADCETKGVEEPNGYVRMDSNNIFSWGRYQWQRPSVQHWVKELYHKELTLQEAGLLAWDLYPSIPLDELTERVAFEVEDGWKEWLNCSKKLGFDKKVEWVKELEK